MNAEPLKEHFLPISQKELLTHLLKEERFLSEEKENFRSFYQILKSVFHFEFLSLHDELKENYHCFDPDPITPPPKGIDRQQAMDRFIQSFIKLMERANFRAITKDELLSAFREETPIAVNVSVELDEYNTLFIYTRGRSRRLETAPFLYIFKKKFGMELYDRLVLLAEFSPTRKKKRARTTVTGMEIERNKVYLKYFKNVPIPDIEMIFPDPHIKMTKVDKIKISLILLAPLAVAGSEIVALLGGNVSQRILTGAIVVIVGYVIRSFFSYRNTVIRYVKNLTQGLYFKNLDNNSGVFDAIVNEAEEEEVKEAMLAYYFLLTHGSMNQEELDTTVEGWFKDRLNLDVDFEVDDALRKLQRLELAHKGDQEVWQVIPLPVALQRLDYLWDHYFEYNKPVGPDETPITDYQQPDSTEQIQGKAKPGQSLHGPTDQ